MAREKDRFESHIGFLVHEVSRKRRKYFDRVLRPLGLTRSQLVMLLHLSRVAGIDGINQRELALVMDIGEASLRESVILLEGAGAIERRSDPDDRRLRRVVLTPRGREMIAQSNDIVESMNADIRGDVSQEDSLIAEKVLKSMAQNLTILISDSQN